MASREEIIRRAKAMQAQVADENMSPTARRRAKMDLSFTPQNELEQGFAADLERANRQQDEALFGLGGYLPDQNLKRYPSGDVYLSSWENMFPRNLSREKRYGGGLLGAVLGGTRDALDTTADAANSATLRMGDDALGYAYDAATGGDAGKRWAQETNDFGEANWRTSTKAGALQTAGTIGGAIAPTNVANLAVKAPGAVGRYMGGTLLGNSAAAGLGGAAAIQGIAQGDGNFDQQYAKELLDSDMLGIIGLEGGPSMRYGVPGLAAATPPLLALGLGIGRAGSSWMSKSGAERAGSRQIAKDMARQGADPTLLRATPDQPGGRRPSQGPRPSQAGAGVADDLPPTPGMDADEAARRILGKPASQLTPGELRQLEELGVELGDTTDVLRSRRAAAVRMGGAEADIEIARQVGKAERRPYDIYDETGELLGDDGSATLRPENQRMLERNQGRQSAPERDPLRYETAPRQISRYLDDIEDARSTGPAREGYDHMPGSTLPDEVIEGGVPGRPDIVSTHQAAEELERLAGDAGLGRVADELERNAGQRLVRDPSGRAVNRLPEPRSVAGRMVDPLDSMPPKDLRAALRERGIDTDFTRGASDDYAFSEALERLRRARKAEAGAADAADIPLRENPARVQQIKRAAQDVVQSHSGPGGDPTRARSAQKVADLADEVLKRFRTKDGLRPALEGDTLSAPLQRATRSTTDATGREVKGGAFQLGKKIWSEAKSATDVHREVRAIRKRIAKAEADVKRFPDDARRAQMAEAAKEELHAYRMGAMDSLQKELQGQKTEGAKSVFSPSNPRVSEKIDALFAGDAAAASKFKRLLAKHRLQGKAEYEIFGNSATAKRLLESKGLRDDILAAHAGVDPSLLGDVMERGILPAVRRWARNRIQGISDAAATNFSRRVAGEILKQLRRTDLSKIADEMERAAAEGRAFQLSGNMAKRVYSEAEKAAMNERAFKPDDGSANFAVDPDDLPAYRSGGDDEALEAIRAMSKRDLKKLLKGGAGEITETQRKAALAAIRKMKADEAKAMAGGSHKTGKAAKAKMEAEVKGRGRGAADSPSPRGRGGEAFPVRPEFDAHLPPTDVTREARRILKAAGPSLKERRDAYFAVRKLKPTPKEWRRIAYETRGATETSKEGAVESVRGWVIMGEEPVWDGQYSAMRKGVPEAADSPSPRGRGGEYVERLRGAKSASEARAVLIEIETDKALTPKQRREIVADVAGVTPSSVSNKAGRRETIDGWWPNRDRHAVKMRQLTEGSRRFFVDEQTGRNPFADADEAAQIPPYRTSDPGDVSEIMSKRDLLKVLRDKGSVLTEAQRKDAIAAIRRMKADEARGAAKRTLGEAHDTGVAAKAAMADDIAGRAKATGRPVDQAGQQEFGKLGRDYAKATRAGRNAEARTIVNRTARRYGVSERTAKGWLDEAAETAEKKRAALARARKRRERAAAKEREAAEAKARRQAAGEAYMQEQLRNRRFMGRDDREAIGEFISQYKWRLLGLGAAGAATNAVVSSGAREAAEENLNAIQELLESRSPQNREKIMAEMREIERRWHPLQRSHALKALKRRMEKEDAPALIKRERSAIAAALKAMDASGTIDILERIRTQERLRDIDEMSKLDQVRALRKLRERLEQKAAILNAKNEKSQAENVLDQARRVQGKAEGHRDKMQTLRDLLRAN